MKIKDVLIDALIKVGRSDVADEYSEGGTPAGEKAEVAKTLLYCINATEDELARYYFPLRFKEKLKFTGGVCSFKNFSRIPVRILKVRADGKEVAFTVSPEGLFADVAEADVDYFYAPARKDVDGDSEFGDIGDGMITSLGAASEYCLVLGESSMAEVWEERYRSAIDRARNRIDKDAYIPPRRWV